MQALKYPWLAAVVGVVLGLLIPAPVVLAQKMAPKFTSNPPKTPGFQQPFVTPYNLPSGPTPPGALGMQTLALRLGLGPGAFVNPSYSYSHSSLATSYPFGNPTGGYPYSYKVMPNGSIYPFNQNGTPYDPTAAFYNNPYSAFYNANYTPANSYYAQNYGGYGNYGGNGTYQNSYSAAPQAASGGQGYGGGAGQMNAGNTAGVIPFSIPAANIPFAGSGVNVGMYDDYFQPAALTIEAGTTVSWTNKGKHLHSLTLPGWDWQPQNVANGAAYSFTFNKAGTYQFEDPLYRDTMKLTIVVK